MENVRMFALASPYLFTLLLYMAMHGLCWSFGQVLHACTILLRGWPPTYDD